MTGNDRAPRLLFVEDDIGKRYVIARQLRAAGFEVDEASTGDQGLAMATPEHEVAVLDIRLPDMSGWDVCRRLKENPTTSRIMVLALSATYVTAEDRAVGLDKGVDVYLVHPVEMVELVACINSLVRLRRVIEDRDVQKELFVATVGHDLRSPLSVLDLALEMLDASTNLDERDRALVAKIQRSSTRIKLLTDQLLRMIRSIVGEEELQREEVDLEALVRHVLEDLADRVRVKLEVAAPPIHVSGDPVSLTQLLDNLVSNALRHGEGDITIRLYNDDQDACIVVHNQGTPIAPDEIGTLFRPFKQAARKKQGFGLGLFIVDRIAQEHGGSVSVTSDRSQGTAFVVRLPITT